MDKNSTQKLPTIDALHEALENDNRETAKMVIASLHPSEIADGIFFLCSDDASAITGIVLPIDCGWLSYVTYNQHPGLPFHE